MFLEQKTTTIRNKKNLCIFVFFKVYSAQFMVPNEEKSGLNQINRKQ